jgi:hypothetical protein
MTLEALVRMKNVFESIREKHAGGDKLLLDLMEKIPSARSFMLYEAILIVLKRFRTESELLSGDKYSTSCQVMTSLYNISAAIKEVHNFNCNF